MLTSLILHYFGCHFSRIDRPTCCCLDCHFRYFSVVFLDFVVIGHVVLLPSVVVIVTVVVFMVVVVVLSIVLFYLLVRHCFEFSNFVIFVIADIIVAIFIVFIVVAVVYHVFVHFVAILVVVALVVDVNTFLVCIPAFIKLVFCVTHLLLPPHRRCPDLHPA